MFLRAELAGKMITFFLLAAPPPSSPLLSTYLFIDPTKVTSYLHIDINEHGQDMGGEILFRTVTIG